jgi:hypothetical protein
MFPATTAPDGETIENEFGLPTSPSPNAYALFACTVPEPSVTLPDVACPDVEMFPTLMPLP